ncbi:MAG: hypothetical protein ACFUZC_19585 [Chthoniobacteraceae bacterium]
MMKKFTLSALAAITVAGTAFAGPETVVTSKEYKQPCVTPCFRDTELQLDLFYSYNNAEHQGSNSATDSHFFGPETTPVSSLVPGGSGSLLNNTDVIPAGSTVTGIRNTQVKDSPYFRDGSGGGLGLNYIFYRYFGIGVEGNWWNGINSGYSGSYISREVVSLPAGSDATTVAAAVAAATSKTSVTVLNSSTLVLKRSVKYGRSSASAAQQVTGNLFLRYPFEGAVCWAPYIFGGGGGIFDGEATGFGHVGVGVEFRVTPYMGFFTDWRWEFTAGSYSNSDWRNDSSIKALAKAVGGYDKLNISDTSTNKNDVSITRVGVRFVF